MNNHINMQTLVEYYMFANTPLYLYRHFRNDVSVQQFASKTSSEEIYNKYNAVALKDEKTLEDVVLSYAYLMALSLKEYSEAAPFLRRVIAYNLDWVNVIKNIIISTAKADNRFFIVISKNVQSYRQFTSSYSVKLTKLYS